VLEDGHIYRSLGDNSYISNTSSDESGSYKCTNASVVNIIYANIEYHLPQDSTLINISGGEFSTNNHVSGFTAYFVNATVNISGGKFIGNGVYFSQVNAQLSGGEFQSVENKDSIVAPLLKAGYGFRTIDNVSNANGKWVNQVEGAVIGINDLANESLPYKTRVEQLPLEIKRQPSTPANAVYGYTSAPQVSMLAEKTSAATLGGDK